MKKPISLLLEDRLSAWPASIVHSSSLRYLALQSLRVEEALKLDLVGLQHILHVKRESYRSAELQLTRGVRQSLEIFQSGYVGNRVI